MPTGLPETLEAFKQWVFQREDFHTGAFACPLAIYARQEYPQATVGSVSVCWGDSVSEPLSRWQRIFTQVYDALAFEYVETYVETYGVYIPIPQSLVLNAIDRTNYILQAIAETAD